MNNISSLLHSVFFGEFGLLTLTPAYLFLVLFPILLLVGILGRLLPRIPVLRMTGPFAGQCFYSLIGLGCTTAALAALNPLTDKESRSRMCALLVLLIPCSAQLTLIAAFAQTVALRVFITYLFFLILFSGLLYHLLGKVCPLTENMVTPRHSEEKFSPFAIIKESFDSTLKTALPFAAGSLLITLCAYFGLADRLCALTGPLLKDWFNLPPEAAELLILNILKRDFGAASLLISAGRGTFDAAQLTTVCLMMTFSVPCFNSSVLLIKQKGLPAAALLWLGSLIVSLFVGKIVSAVFLICLV